MHCLYCDRPLALLKRLTGDGEFCSKEHRKIYQREHSQLALQRLLEAQHAATGNGKARPSKMPVVNPPEPVAPPPVVVAPPPVVVAPPPPVVVAPPPPAGRQPPPAGFFSGSLDARGASSAARPPGLPRFKAGGPVWSGVAMRAAGRAPGPRTAIFLTEFPGPRTVESAFRRQDGSALLPGARPLHLTENRHGDAGIAAGLQPSGAGFLSSQPGASALPGKTLRAGDPRFGPLAQARGLSGQRAGVDAVSRNANPGIRPAAFVAGFPAGAAAANTAANLVRLPDGLPRWRPLDPVFPQREPEKITLVLGVLLQRPVRPASHDRMPETFEIPFQPVSFPAYTPGMGCLEERLHRTDRVGFSPP